jgi:phage terminase Nu1 subunit (DNA packaging protein)
MKDALTLSEAAVAAKKSISTVQGWMDQGLSTTKEGRHRRVQTLDLIRWLATREAQPGSTRERLANEQADKVALENAERRGQLVRSDQVAEVLSWLAAEMTARIEAVPGRVAGEFAGITDASVIRGRLLDELRGVRAAYADAAAKLAECLGK